MENITTKVSKAFLAHESHKILVYSIVDISEHIRLKNQRFLSTVIFEKFDGLVAKALEATLSSLKIREICGRMKQ